MQTTHGKAPAATDEQSLKTWRIQVTLRQKIKSPFGNSMAEAIHLLRNELKEHYYIDLINIEEIESE
jgi:hypothetical protein